jgi:hypothetical protein
MRAAGTRGTRVARIGGTAGTLLITVVASIVRFFGKDARRLAWDQARGEKQETPARGRRFSNSSAPA